MKKLPLKTPVDRDMQIIAISLVVLCAWALLMAGLCVLVIIYGGN